MTETKPGSTAEGIDFPKDTLLSLEKPYVDARGMIQPLVDVDMKSCVLIASKKGTVRANHYHKTDWHYCYLLSGSMEYYQRPVGSRTPPERLVVKAGQMVFTPPLAEHAMVFLEDTTFLAFGRNSRKQESYEADIVRIAPLQPA